MVHIWSCCERQFGGDKKTAKISPRSEGNHLQPLAYEYVSLMESVGVMRIGYY